MKGDAIDRERIREEATQWVAKSVAGFSAEEQDDFFIWMGADSRHSDEFAAAKKLWERMNNLSLWVPEHSDVPNMDLLQTQNRSFWRKGVSWYSAAAAALLITLGSVLILKSLPKEGMEFERSVVADDYDSEKLPDGSTVELNGGSEIFINYSETERHVTLLANEAYFEVAKDSKRPFIVEARGVKVRAIGTAFNVRIEQDEIEVLVTEGTIQVASEEVDSDESRDGSLVAETVVAELTVGEMTVISVEDPEPVKEVQKASIQELEQRLNWKPKMFEYDSTPLWQVVNDFNMRNHVQIEIADPELEDALIVISLRSSSVDHFIDLLEFSMGIQAKYVAEDRVRLSKG